MKHKFTINQKSLTIAGCILAMALFIVSCVISDPEPATGINKYKSANQIVDKHMDLFQ